MDGKRLKMVKKYKCKMENGVLVNVENKLPYVKIEDCKIIEIKSSVNANVGNHLEKIIQKCKYAKRYTSDKKRLKEKLKVNCGET